MLHIIRLGTHAEKDYLLRGSAWFDELVVNANLVEAGANATGLFVRDLAKRHKGFFIDPVTYAFAQDPYYIAKSSGERPKRTFSQLAERYGEPVSAAVQGRRAVQPHDFAEDDVVESFCHRVLTYQAERLDEALTMDQTFLPGETTQAAEQEALQPTRLIAPYFYVDEMQTWLAVNRRIAEASCALASEFQSEVWVVLCLSRSFLDRQSELEQLTSVYSALHCAGFLIWVTDFDEHDAAFGQLLGLRRLVNQLAQTGRNVIKIFGGYFSVLLGEDGLAGLSHGVGYGERRDIVPVLGGGLPPAKYYLRPIHNNVYIADMLRLAAERDEESFQQTVCSCVICSGLMERGGIDRLVNEFGATELRPFRQGFREVPTARVYELSRYHYLHNRYLELQTAGQSSRADLISQLNDAYGNLSGFLGASRVSFLPLWSSALQHPLE